jgi:hypothetical protein
VAEGLLAEGQQSENDAWRIVLCRLGQVGSRQVRAGAQRVDEVAVDGQVKHLLLGHHENGRAPPLDRRQLVLGQALLDGPLQTERGEQVLAHEGVLQLRRRTEHVDQRLAVLDDERAVASG